MWKSVPRIHDACAFALRLTPCIMCLCFAPHTLCASMRLVLFKTKPRASSHLINHRPNKTSIAGTISCWAWPVLIGGKHLLKHLRLIFVFLKSGRISSLNLKLACFRSPRLLILILRSDKEKAVHRRAYTLCTMKPKPCGQASIFRGRAGSVFLLLIFHLEEAPGVRTSIFLVKHLFTKDAFNQICLESNNSM